MTSTTDTAQHPDVSEIADLAEGVLSPERTADLRKHLDGCVLCADVHDSLEEIRGLLGTLPGPPRMPADVAGRIDAALAAEALLDATTPEGAAEAETPSATADVSRETVPATTPSPRADAPDDVTDTVRADRPSVDRPGTERPADRPAGRPKAGSTGPGRGGRPRPRRRRAAVLSAVLGTALVGLGVLLVPSFSASDTGDVTGQAAPVTGHASEESRQFSGTPLQKRVDTLLAAGGGGATAGETKAGRPRALESEQNTTSNSPLFQSAPSVPPCIERGIGSELSALAVEQGTYQDTAAYLVVVPVSGDSTRVQAYVVDASCVTDAPSAAGTVLLTHSYPRR
ncbi:hypothetical protein AB0O07_31730 [Streptomyces sp. NPDC093085]|uniref:hypothetical protein n=1 Tax=Streptomyces sp. NPDC093085 TaxID=3155068 RepID=UPI003427007C